ncbi:MAG: hypothetical protein M1133_02715 [Armatimonadetes bacterium]|nr:hypothetical protein [Armatimonadota bacterium]
MRYSISLLMAALLTFIAAGAFCADALEVATTPASVTAKRGQAVPVSVNLRNMLSPREPVTITAEAEWEDEYGAVKTTTASTTITVVQPVKINRYKVAIPALFAFVAGSAKVGGQPVTPGLDVGQLVFDMGQTLLEGESVALEYSVRPQ